MSRVTAGGDRQNGPVDALAEAGRGLLGAEHRRSHPVIATRFGFVLIDRRVDGQESAFS